MSEAIRLAFYAIWQRLRSLLKVLLHDQDQVLWNLAVLLFRWILHFMGVTSLSILWLIKLTRNHKLKYRNHHEHQYHIRQILHLWTRDAIKDFPIISRDRESTNWWMNDSIRPEVEMKQQKGANAASRMSIDRPSKSSDMGITNGSSTQTCSKQEQVQSLLGLLDK